MLSPMILYCVNGWFIVFQLNLTTLDLASNRITKIENVSHLVKLEEFWVMMCFV